MTDYVGTRPEPVTSNARDDKVDPPKPEFVVFVHYLPSNAQGLQIDTFLTDDPDHVESSAGTITWFETYLKSNGTAYFREPSARLYNMRHVVKIVYKNSRETHVSWRG